MQPDTERLAAFLAGFVAAEGTFNGDGDRRFRFAVGLGSIDKAMCLAFHDFLGVGSIHHSPRRKPHYDDEVQFCVQSTRELVEVVVPFMDAHLPPSYKREQYEDWRRRLLDHWTHRARRRKTCSEDACSTPAKAYGLCRHHLWAIRRQ